MFKQVGSERFAAHDFPGSACSQALSGGFASF